MYEAGVEDVRSIVAQEVSFQKNVGATIDTIAQKNAQIKSYQRNQKEQEMTIEKVHKRTIRLINPGLR